MKGDSCAMTDCIVEEDGDNVLSWGSFMTPKITRDWLAYFVAN